MKPAQATALQTHHCQHLLHKDCEAQRALAQTREYAAWRETDAYAAAVGATGALQRAGCLEKNAARHCGKLFRRWEDATRRAEDTPEYRAVAKTSACAKTQDTFQRAANAGCLRAAAGARILCNPLCPFGPLSDVDETPSSCIAAFFCT